MTNVTVGSLREIQKLDERMRTLREEIESFDPRLAEVEEPALQLESELSKVTERLEQMRADARRLERSAEDKRARATRLDERLNQVTNLREEAAVKTEVDLIKRAIDTDEQEALQFLDGIRKAEVVVDELTVQAQEARDSVQPQQEALLEARAGLQAELDDLRARRDAAMEMLGEEERRVYESFHASGRLVVVASLTEDGACGHCFGMVPLQFQNEIRTSGGLLRCEACGVILTAEPEPEPVEKPEAAAEADADAAPEPAGADEEEAGEPSPETEPSNAGGA